MKYRKIIENFVNTYFDKVEIEEKKNTIILSNSDVKIYVVVDEEFLSVKIHSYGYLSTYEYHNIEHLKNMLIDIISLEKRGLVNVK